MSEEEVSVENNSASSVAGKKKPQKKHYPFGTPSHKVPYSQYNHLKATDILLFQEISHSEGIKAEIRSGDEDLSRDKDRQLKRLPVKVDDDFLKYAQPAKPEDGVELCKRIDCRNLLRKILESMSTLQLERDNIGTEIELGSSEYAAAEQEAVQLDEKLRMITRENDQLEATLEHLNAQVAKLEAKKLELQQERDEFGNKMMVTETEKQNWIRLVQQAHKGLADAMWRGERQPVEAAHTEIVLHKREAGYDSSKHDRAVSTSYRRLASAGVLDYSERPPPAPTSSIPLYLRSVLLPSASGSPGPGASAGLEGSWEVGNSNTDAFSTTSSAGSNAGNRHSRLKPLVMDDDTRLRRKIDKLQHDNSPFVSRTHANAYRGYTPTGAPANRLSSPHRIAQTHFQEAASLSLLTVKKQLSKSTSSLDRKALNKLSISLNNSQDLLSFSSEMNNSEFSNNPEHTWQRLDPVFYHSRAGEAFSRKEKIGRQKMIKNQIEFTKLLTYQHPGLLATKQHSDL